MKKIEDVLSKEEEKRYQREWEAFDQKSIPETKYHTHSGKSVISKVYRFEGKSVFRARVRKKKLREIDPYFISQNRYVFPCWHVIHYFIVLEQMYHASMHLIKNNHHKVKVLDVPGEIKLSERIFWNENISVELIRESRRDVKGYGIEDCFVTFYNDKVGEVRSRFSVRTFVKKRAYVSKIEKIKEGETEEIEALVKIMENRETSQKSLINPRKTLATKDFLIEELREGRIPEEELHDFFSFWDK